MPYYVYILRTDKGSLYTGQTNNIEKRILKHESGKGAKYLRAFKEFRLVYKEEFVTRHEAMVREVEIKKLSKKQKEVLVLGSK